VRENRIATILLKHAYQNLYDHVVLIGGDGDFYDAISTVKDDLRKKVSIVGFQDGSVSCELQAVADIIWMNTLLDRVETQEMAQILPQQQPTQNKTAIYNQRVNPSGTFLNGSGGVATITTAAIAQNGGSSVAPVAFTPSEATWACGKCTYENIATDLVCEMCSVSRPVPPVPIQPFVYPATQQQFSAPLQQQQPPQRLFVPQQQPFTQQQTHYGYPQQQQPLVQQQRPYLPQQQPVFVPQPQQQRPPIVQEQPRPQIVQEQPPPPQDLSKSVTKQECACPVCTYHRPSSAHKCDMCGFVP